MRWMTSRVFKVYLLSQRHLESRFGTFAIGENGNITHKAFLIHFVMSVKDTVTKTDTA